LDCSIVHLEQERVKYCQGYRSYRVLLKTNIGCCIARNQKGYPKMINPESLVVSVIKDNYDCKWSVHAGMKKTQKYLISRH